MHFQSVGRQGGGRRLLLAFASSVRHMSTVTVFCTMRVIASGDTKSGKAICFAHDQYYIAGSVTEKNNDQHPTSLINMICSDGALGRRPIQRLHHLDPVSTVPPKAGAASQD